MRVGKERLEERKKKLVEINKQLKTEFFGLDNIIDKVVSSVYAWYVFPELIKRPVIVNLWGMTGVGKTQLVRRLSQLLEFTDKFVEIQMDGTSGGSGYKKDSICSILSGCIDENEPGILLLDEIQRFRTISDDGLELKVDRFQDVWMLLSDGKFSANSELFSELEMMLAYSDWEKDNQPEDGEGEEDGLADKPKKAKTRQFKVYPYEAKMLKKLLRLTDPINEIMAWDATKVYSMIKEIKSTRTSWEIDYSKLLIFVSGNLDNAFLGAGDTEDCDTDADFYHEVTKKITSSVIKKSLSTRFKPEQVSRLGNNHIIYPSMSKLSYQQLIRSTVSKYVAEMSDTTEISFGLDPAIFDTIYANSVYPTQGTRPVFSSIHMIFSTALVNISCWCIENNINDIDLAIDNDKQLLIATDRKSGSAFSAHVELEMTTRKSKTSIDFKTVVAVHEAGHAIVYALLTKSAPVETKINTISFSGGYMLSSMDYVDDHIITKSDQRDKIAISLAGTVAEEIIFGKDNRSTGCSEDLISATMRASQYIRKLGFHSTISYINTANAVDINWNTNISNSNDNVEILLTTEYKRAESLIRGNISYFYKLVDKLLEINTVDQDSFIALSKEFTDLEKEPQSSKFYDMYKKKSIR